MKTNENSFPQKKKVTKLYMWELKKLQQQKKRELSKVSSKAEKESILHEFERRENELKEKHFPVELDTPSMEYSTSSNGLECNLTEHESPPLPSSEDHEISFYQVIKPHTLSKAEKRQMKKIQQRQNLLASQEESPGLDLAQHEKEAIIEYLKDLNMNCVWNDPLHVEIDRTVTNILRYCLIMESSDISIAALRTCRYFLFSDGILTLFTELCIPEFVVLSVEAVPESANDVSRVTALRFMRRWCALSASGCSCVAIPPCFVHCLVELCADESPMKELREYDCVGVSSSSNTSQNFRLACLKTLRDLCVSHTASVIQAGGLSVLLDAITDLRLAEIDPTFSYSLSVVLSFLFNAPQSHSLHPWGGRISALLCSNPLSLPLQDDVWDVELSRLCCLIQRLLHAHTPLHGHMEKGEELMGLEETFLTEEKETHFTSNETQKRVWILGASALLTFCKRFRYFVEQLKQPLAEELSLWIVRFFHSLLSIALGLDGKCVTEEDCSQIQQNRILPSSVVHPSPKTWKEGKKETLCSSPFIFASSAHPTSTHRLASFLKGNSIHKTSKILSTESPPSGGKEMHPSLSSPSLFSEASQKENETKNHTSPPLSFPMNSHRSVNLQETLGILICRILLDCDLHFALASVCVEYREKEQWEGESTLAEDYEILKTRFSVKQRLYCEATHLLSVFVFATSAMLHPRSFASVAKVCLMAETKNNLVHQRSATARIHAFLTSLSLRLSLSHTSLSSLYLGREGREKSSSSRGEIFPSMSKCLMKVSETAGEKISIFHDGNFEGQKLPKLPSTSFYRLKQIQSSHVTSAIFPPPLPLTKSCLLEMEMIIDTTNVLTQKDFQKWDWNIIRRMLFGPLWTSLKVMEESPIISKFLQRLLLFYYPQSHEFSSMEWKTENLSFVWIGIYLIFLLLHKSDEGIAEGLYIEGKICFISEIIQALNEEIPSKKRKTSSPLPTFHHSPSSPCIHPSTVTPSVQASLLLKKGSSKEEMISTKLLSEEVHTLHPIPSKPCLFPHTFHSSDTLYTLNQTLNPERSLSHSLSFSQASKLPFSSLSSPPPASSLSSSPSSSLLPLPTSSSPPLLPTSSSPPPLPLPPPISSSPPPLPLPPPIFSSPLHPPPPPLSSLPSVSSLGSETSPWQDMANTASFLYQKNVSSLWKFPEGEKDTIFSWLHVTTTLSREYAALVGALVMTSVGERLFSYCKFYDTLLKLLNHPKKDYLSALFLPYINPRTLSGGRFFEHLFKVGSPWLMCVAVQNLENLWETKTSWNSVGSGYHFLKPTPPPYEILPESLLSWVKGVETFSPPNQSCVLNDTLPYATSPLSESSAVNASPFLKEECFHPPQRDLLQNISPPTAVHVPPCSTPPTRRKATPLSSSPTFIVSPSSPSLVRKKEGGVKPPSRLSRSIRSKEARFFSKVMAQTSLKTESSPPSPHIDVDTPSSRGIEPSGTVFSASLFPLSLKCEETKDSVVPITPLTSFPSHFSLTRSSVSAPNVFSLEDTIAGSSPLVELHHSPISQRAISIRSSSPSKFIKNSSPASSEPSIGKQNE
ncbi:hypothetical protein IE077_000268, partial [Cardiosporidium cionae]